MRIASLRFGLTIAAVLVIQIAFFLYWHGDKVKQYAFPESGVINATFANFHLEYEIVTNFSADRCKGKQLFIFVMTTVKFFAQRDVIRRTWASKNHTADALVVFIVGKDEKEENMKLMREENERYGDIIETTIPDVYNYTALKIHAGYYLHTKYCFDVPFVLRADDDVIVLPDRFVHFIKAGFFNNTGKAIYGIIWTEGKPVRDPSHKWYIPPEYYKPDTFPPYVNGPAYLMTRLAPKAILEKTKETTFFWIEDVMFTGIMANSTGVKLIDANGIFKSTIPHCLLSQTTAPNQSMLHTPTTPLSPIGFEHLDNNDQTVVSTNPPVTYQTNAFSSHFQLPRPSSRQLLTGPPNGHPSTPPESQNTTSNASNSDGSPSPKKKGVISKFFASARTLAPVVAIGTAVLKLGEYLADGSDPIGDISNGVNDVIDWATS
ncbi:hypothetical protein QR680_006937 [Steinernema hermaphroditum]|uniref:Hexosyltransferase n=1 Tax=Steinernema hermaphroditum TaxID=289476 RepID=A0AA39LXX4_9BILA|nr:hypothetical protein QR680_006937 [Steinernema hermaphroditum]